MRVNELQRPRPDKPRLGQFFVPYESPLKHFKPHFAQAAYVNDLQENNAGAET